MIMESLEIGALIVDLVGVTVMVIGFIIALYAFLKALPGLNTMQHVQDIQIIRCKLGVYIALGLELMIVSDLLHTIASHTLEDLYFLGALVIIRTLIGYFLSKEIAEIEHSGKA